LKLQNRKLFPWFLSDYLLAAVLYCLLNLVVFHGSLYRYLCVVDSYAGNVYGRLASLESTEQNSSKKPVALIGDSTTEHGIGAAELSELMGHPSVNLAMPGAGPLEWLHYLRSIDPDQNRFHTIVLLVPPHNMRSFPGEDGIQTLMPVVSIPEMIRYAHSFKDAWHNHLDLYYVSFDRLYGFRRDVSDLILHPSRLAEQSDSRINFIRQLEHWEGETMDVCSTEVNLKTGRILNWGNTPHGEIRRLTSNAVRRISQLNAKPALSGILEPLASIIEYYDNSTTNIAMVTIPFGLGHRVRRNTPAMRPYFDAASKYDALPNVSHMDASRNPIFDDCSNFYDFRHLNAKGRKLFTADVASFLKTAQVVK
jgi:hypothetical protein